MCSLKNKLHSKTNLCGFVDNKMFLGWVIDQGQRKCYSEI